MVTFVPSVAALSISTIYCLWHAWYVQRCQNERALRQRVAYMLWVAADRAA
jgi:hypothetical protein